MIITEMNFRDIHDEVVRVHESGRGDGDPEGKDVTYRVEESGGRARGMLRLDDEDGSPIEVIITRWHEHPTHSYSQARLDLSVLAFEAELHLKWYRSSDDVWAGVVDDVQPVPQPGVEDVQALEAGIAETLTADVHDAYMAGYQAAVAGNARDSCPNDAEWYLAGWGEGWDAGSEDQADLPEAD